MGPLPRDPTDIVQLGRDLIAAEANALTRLVESLSDSFCAAVATLFHCQGSVTVSGMGKAGLVGQKIAATLASTGTPSQFIHPSEALHGDLGRIRPQDCAMLLSNSGETDEVIQLLTSLVDMAVPVIALTSNPASRLGLRATITLDLYATEEACSLGLAPSTSTTAMLAMGDALALVTSQLRGFTSEDFARFHPGGSLGRKLAKVQDVMRPLSACCVARDNQTIRQIYVHSQRPRRRSGAILLVDDGNRLTGIFTDSDLARLFEKKRDDALDHPIREIMTTQPITIRSGTRLLDAVEVMVRHKISELPVVDRNHCPVGLIDITDIVGLLPRQLAPDGDATPSDEENSASPAGDQHDRRAA